jgi:hypothetical protein
MLLGTLFMLFLLVDSGFPKGLIILGRAFLLVSAAWSFQVVGLRTAAEACEG